MSNPKLTILSEVLRGQTFELTKDTYTIGRSEDKDITIVDPTVSGLHAILTRNGDGTYLVKDNGSTNGTRINGVIITEQSLSTSDILQVGGVEIMFDFEGQTPENKGATTVSIPVDKGVTQINSEMGKLYGKDSGKAKDSSLATLLMKIGIGILFIVAIVLAVMLAINVMGGSSDAGG